MNKKGYIIEKIFEDDSDNIMSYDIYNILRPDGECVANKVYGYQLNDILQKLPDLYKDKIQYLESLDKDDVLGIIKYGLRDSNAPLDVTVEDIYEVIGCLYIADVM